MIALSSGEAEFYSLTKGIAQGMGMQSLLRDMGVDLELRLMTDATTGKAIASRRGLGKIRHIETHELWVQDAVLKGRVTVVKLKNVFNTADVLTKYVDRRTLEEAVSQLQHQFEEGRSSAAPTLGSVSRLQLPDKVIEEILEELEAVDDEDDNDDEHHEVLHLLVRALKRGGAPELLNYIIGAKAHQKQAEEEEESERPMHQAEAAARLKRK